MQTPVRAKEALRSWEREPARVVWDRVEPFLTSVGITRVAELTGLDIIGVPVFAGIRPSARSVVVSAGKNLNQASAQLGAAVESLEVFAAEAVPAAGAVRAAPRELELPYEVLRLPQQRGSVVTTRSSLNWMEVSTLSGLRTLLPVDCVRLGYDDEASWRPAGFLRSSNGLGADTLEVRARLHALLEVIERQAVSVLPRLPLEDRAVLDPTALQSPDNVTVVKAITRANLSLEITPLPSLTGTCSYVAYLWGSDMPQVFGGSACHVEPEQAVLSAVLEAIQSRLATIGGGRDDLQPRDFSAALTAAKVTRREPTLWEVPVTADGSEDAFEALKALVASVEAVTGQAVLFADLTPPGCPLRISKVLAPGLSLEVEAELARPLLKGEK